MAIYLFIFLGVFVLIAGDCTCSKPLSWNVMISNMELMPLIIKGCIINTFQSIGAFGSDLVL